MRPNIDKIYLHEKDPDEATYQFLTNKHQEEGSDHYDDLKVLHIGWL